MKVRQRYVECTRVQTNHRAELLAVVLACLRDPRLLHIRSDSEYVCKGLACWRIRNGTRWQLDHADPWDMLGGELSTRASQVDVSWVEGHAQLVDIDRGRTTMKTNVAMMVQTLWLS